MQLLIVAGFKKDEVDGMDLSSMSDDEFQKQVRQRLLGAMVNNGVRQKAVAADQIEGEIAGGWEYVSSLPDGRAVMKIP